MYIEVLSPSSFFPSFDSLSFLFPFLSVDSFYDFFDRRPFSDAAFFISTDLFFVFFLTQFGPIPHARVLSFSFPTLW